MRRRVLLAASLLCRVENIGGMTTGSQAGVGVGAGPGAGGTGGGSASSSWTLQRFVCDSSQCPEELPLRRLYLNTVTDPMAQSGLSAGDRRAVVTALAADSARVPEDQLVGLPSEKRGGLSELTPLNAFAGAHRPADDLNVQMQEEIGDHRLLDVSSSLTTSLVFSEWNRLFEDPATQPSGAFCTTRRREPAYATSRSSTTESMPTGSSPPTQGRRS